eukprot:jgi/Ulvmu1/3969/UM181_0003.1
MALVVWLVVGGVVLLQRVHARRKRKDLPKIPLAPGSVPILGNVAVVKAFAQHKLHKLLVEYTAAADNRGIVRMVVAGETTLLATTPAAFAVMRRSGFWPKPLALFQTLAMLGMKRQCIVNEQSASEHERVRSHFMRFFSAENAEKTVGQLAAAVDTSIRNALLACAGKPAPPPRLGPGSSDLDMGVFREDVTAEGVLVNASMFSAFNILRVVFEVLLKVDRVLPAAAMHDVLQQIEEVAAHPVQYALLRRRLYPGYRRYRRNFKTLYKFNCDIVEAMFNDSDPNDTSSLAACLRAAYPDAMTDADQMERAVANAALLYFASYDNLSNAVSHTLSALALDQDSQTALVEELKDARLLATAERPDPPPATAEQLGSLRVLDAICHESLRFLTPEPFTSFRELTTQTNLCGYKVPKGTVVLFAPIMVHHNRRVWGDDASRWRPDRWLEGKSVASVKNDANGQLRFMPFSTGPQACIAQALAMTQLRLLVAMVVSRLHVTMDAQRMAHMHSVEDYYGATITKVSLQQPTPAWLRMRPRVRA